MRRAILLVTLLSMMLTGCSTALNKEEAAEALKRGESSFTVKVGNGDVGDFMSEVFRSDVLILGEDIHFQYGINNEYKGSFLDGYGDNLVSRRAELKFKLAPVVENDYFLKMNDYEKLVYLNDYVVSNVEYDTRLNNNGKTLEASFAEYPESFDIYGATVNGIAVCRGYAEMLKYLLDQSGFESEIAVGTFKGVSHAWVKVKYMDDWYNIDPTSNDGPIPYYTFMRSDSEMVGYVENPSNEFTKVPKSKKLVSDYEYYTYKEKVAKSSDEAIRLVKEGEQAFRFVNVTSSQILVELEKLSMLSGRQYYMDGDVFRLD